MKWTIGQLIIVATVACVAALAVVYAARAGETPVYGPMGAVRWHPVLAENPNQPQDDGECGTPRRGSPVPSRIQKAQFASPLICGHEREDNGTTQEQRAAHPIDLISSAVEQTAP